MKIDIKQKLQESGMTRYELAKRIGVTYPTIDNIYKGTSTSIKFEILESLCRELNCEPNDILVSKETVQKSKTTELTQMFKLGEDKSDTP